MESEKKYLDIISDYIDIILNQRKTIDKLQEIISKAIEYIKQECFDGREYDTHGDYLSIQELLDILNGNEKQ